MSLLIQTTGAPSFQTATFASPVSAGSTIIVAFASVGTPVSVTDDQGQSYTAGGLASNDGRCSIYYFVGSVAGVNSVTVTTSGGNDSFVVAYEISSSTHTGDSTSSGTGVSIVSGDLPTANFYVAIGINDGPESSFSGVNAPWTFGQNANFGDGTFATAYLDASGTSPINATFTDSNVQNWAVSGVAFTGGTPPPPTPSCFPTDFAFTFQKPNGDPIANGKVTFRLNTDAKSCTGQVLRGRLVEATLDSNGSVTVPLWANSSLTPTTTFYTVRAYTDTGLKVYDQQMTLDANFLLQEDDANLFLLETSDGAILLEA